eukprot:GHVL01015226.1.p1 GENE.GHVL01015226.1~~GHVL01015226.1.p1  ORF type:complete len:431 (+),score=48.74 GHVL01015226.1:43-1335(+)
MREASWTGEGCRRLCNVEAIHIRHLPRFLLGNSPKYTLELCVGSETLYSTHTIINSWNPAWHFIDAIRPVHSNIQNFELCLRTVQTQQVILSFTVDLSQLSVVSTADKYLPLLPPASCVIQISGVFFTLFGVPTQEPPVILKESVSINLSDIMNASRIVKENIKIVSDCESKIEEINKKIANIISDTDGNQKQYNLLLIHESVSNNVQKLARRLQEKKNKNKQKLVILPDVQKRAAMLAQCRTGLSSVFKRIEHHEVEKKLQDEDIRKLNLQLHTKRLSVLYGLHKIYPIENSGSFRLIRGFPLGSSRYLLNMYTEQVATALGDVCQLLFFISDYLCISLRFIPIFCGSRSFMCDPLKEFTQYPLFLQPNAGREQKNNFDSGLSMLMRDVNQMLTDRGVNIISDSNILENMEFIFKRELYDTNSITRWHF